MRSFLIGLIGLALEVSGLEDWPCDHEIYCKPNTGILHYVQTLKIFNDSKTFVDSPLMKSVEETMAAWVNITDKTNKEQVSKFVASHFDKAGAELLHVNLSDWKENPAILDKIQHEGYRNLVSVLNKRWKHLARETPQDLNINRTTLIPLPFPFIVPGGRFIEIYYWDTYWTIKGLLLSELNATTKGMLDNFKKLINEYGHIPNGNRVYYVKRSQPPLFSQMVDDYVKSESARDPTITRELMGDYIWEMEKEFKFWMKRFVNVTVKSQTYQLAAYHVEVDGPRPESYTEDWELAQNLNESERREWYGHIKSGAESGWDFSSRWFNDKVDVGKPLLSIITGDILPVDLNSFLYKNARILEEYFDKLEKPKKAEEYKNIANQLKAAISEVLWNEEHYMWFDYNKKTGKQNEKFYISNLAPLYVESHHANLSQTRMFEAIQASGVLNHAGGPPTSLYKTDQHPQQWDYPNVWPPLVEVLVTSLMNLNSTKARNAAQEVAESYLRNVYASFQGKEIMYEKYNCEQIGKAGAGGEYPVQEGFGWSNGVTMSLLDTFPNLVSSALRIEWSALSVVIFVLMLLRI